MANFPTITYTNLKHKVDNGVSGGVIQSKDEAITLVFNNGIGTTNKYRASFNSPHNQITGTLSSNRELSKWQVRVTPAEVDDFGPEVGNCATFITGISANTATNFTVPITQAVFTGSPTNTYRLCLMGQSSLDYSWDCTQLYMVIDTNTSFTNSYTEVEYLSILNNSFNSFNNGFLTSIAWNTINKIEIELQVLNYSTGHTSATDQNIFFRSGVFNSPTTPWINIRKSTSPGYSGLSSFTYSTPYDPAALLNSKQLLTFNFSASSTNTVFIGAWYDSAYSASNKIYQIKFYNETTLVAHFVPCIRNSDNKPGMYDRVNNVFYTNQGSGEFKYGPLKSVPQTYQQVEYIEGDGNQRMTPFRIDKTYTGNLTVGYKFTASSHTDAMYFSTITASLSAGQAYSLGYTGASSPLYIRWNQIADSTTQVAYAIPEVLEITRTNYAENITLGEVSLFAHSTSYKPWKGKIYNYWLKTDSEHIFNLVPCYRKSDNVIGMLDMVNNVFYTNAGSGTFTKGNNVSNKNYIKYKPTDSDGYDVHFVN